MRKGDALNKLKQLSKQLDKVNYGDIIQLFKIIKTLPLPIAKFRSNTPISRVRKNIGETCFYDVHNDLSYIKDQNVIDTYLTEFGRANLPHQPMFYGAIASSLVSYSRLTALAETSKLYQDPEGINFDGELYTVSQWLNKSPLYLADMVFSEEAISENPDTKRNFEHQSLLLKDSKERDINFALDFIVFISDQFARRVSSHHDYKISAAYTDFVLSQETVHGIAYPSVQTKYVGQNVVFPPFIVDNFLEINAILVQRFHKNKKHCVLNNFKSCINPRECLTKLNWVDDSCFGQVAPPEHIYNSLMRI